MQKINQKAVVAMVGLAMLAGLVPGVASAQVTEVDGCEYGCVAQSGGVTWKVMGLSADSEAGGNVESFKVDRDLVAWTVRDEQAGLRRLHSWNGVSTRLLASMDIDEWSDGNGFYDSVAGSYDVADGVVVWTQFDGADREIFASRNGRTVRLTDNSYDDAHPVTSEGRFAWTSYPGNGTYHLMLSDYRGTRSVGVWHVMNYAFSGPNLYWSNSLPGENWFRVFVHDGTSQRSVGIADDRAIPDYFVTDDEGSAAWEYSTKQWSYDKRRIFVSYRGNDAVEALQRDVPPTVTRLEDVRGGEVLVGVHDMLTTKLDDVSLVHASGSWQATVDVKRAFSKARFSDGAHVRHQTPETSSPLVVRREDGSEDTLTLERVEHDVFDAQDGTIAAALHDHGGVILNRDGETVVMERDLKAKRMETRNDTVAWIEGESGEAMLVVATPAVLVTEGGSTSYVTGRLVKSPLSSAVYLAAPNGHRYVFPSEGEFYSWYPGFGSLQNLEADEVAAMPLAGTVIYPAGTLLKTPSSPKVYTVKESGALAWVSDGLVLESLYGSDWNRQVRDLAEAFMVAYRIDRSVASIGDYYAAMYR